jgi:3,4-dihydroxy 2-butanone 4-phosphate synthase / GTP cyclohydrolase II
VDLARIAGLEPSGVICEIMNDDGTMARVPQLVEFCREHGLKLLTVAELIRYRMKHERHVRRIGESTLPTKYGDFRMIAYTSDVDHEMHVALVRGDIANEDPEVMDSRPGDAPPLVRVHSHCLTGDVLGSTACDCRDAIEGSLKAIADEGRGVFVYLHHRGRGFLIDSRTEEGATLPRIIFHQREHVDREAGVQRFIQHESGIGAQILKDLGLRRIRVLTNLPRKVVALQGYGLEIAEQVPLGIKAAKQSHQVL